MFSYYVPKILYTSSFSDMYMCNAKMMDICLRFCAVLCFIAIIFFRFDAADGSAV